MIHTTTTTIVAPMFCAIANTVLAGGVAATTSVGIHPSIFFGSLACCDPHWSSIIFSRKASLLRPPLVAATVQCRQGCAAAAAAVAMSGGGQGNGGCAKRSEEESKGDKAKETKKKKEQQAAL